MKKSCILSLALLSTSTAFAEKDEHREHGAHQHGHATLSVIVEKNDLLVMLESPAMNVFGFEHKPENDKQKEAVKTALKDLEGFDKLVAINSDAGCSLVKSKIANPFEMAAKDHDDHHDDDHKDDHKDEHHDDDHKDDHKDEHHDDDHKEDHKEDKHHEDDHKDEHHDDHKDGDHKDHDDHEEHKESTHSDVDAEISFKCKNTSKLTEMDLAPLFKRFPLFEELEAQGIINGQQSAEELSKGNSVFSLKK